jgi:hypothetical protein
MSDDDTEITEQIRAFLSEINEFNTESGRALTRSFQLEFEYRRKPYTTVFTVERKSDYLIVNNKCINLGFTIYEGMSEISTSLSANSEEKHCFDPILESDPRIKPGRRITSVDVLQILKTKLYLVLPMGDEKVTIMDQAKKDGIAISPFNILRGGNAIYEKYGYESDYLTGLKEKLKTFKWSDCNDGIKAIIQDCVRHSDETLKADIIKKINKMENPLLIEMMRLITWELEKRYNADTAHEALSHYVFHQFAKIVGHVSVERTAAGPYIYRPIWTFQLDQDSSAWRRCNSELLFTKFTPDAAGGGRRKNRRTIKDTKNKSKKTRKRR